MRTTKQIGDLGEDIAARYLMRKGYRIRERNYRAMHGEIDIIAEKDGMVIFVEVKTRTNMKYGTPAEAVNAQKQRMLLKTAYAYLKGAACAVRFDVIEVLYRKETAYIHHIENAFGE